MNGNAEEAKILLRTFDLPDIYFASVSELDEHEKTFTAQRSANGESLDSLALSRWYEQSKLASDAEARRDCWLQINNKIYVIWGASIQARKDVDNGQGSVEQWEFSFDEMRRYCPTPN